MTKKTAVLPAETHIGRVHLKVSNLERALAFYQDLLGFHLAEQGGATAALSSGASEAVVLRLSAVQGAMRKPPRSSGLYHIAIRLPVRPALGALLRRLLAAEYPLQGAADHLVSEAIYLADPDGNGLELYIDRPREQWQQVSGVVQMATDPLDAVSLLEESKSYGADWHGIAPGTDIGHVHLQVADLGAAEAFYCGLLGFTVTQRSYPGALFVSAGGYHHHIGLNTWAGRGAPPPPPEAVGLAYFRIEIPDPDTRSRLIERLETHQVRLESGENGNKLVYDPDSIAIEI